MIRTTSGVDRDWIRLDSIEPPNLKIRFGTRSLEHESCGVKVYNTAQDGTKVKALHHSSCCFRKIDTNAEL